MTSVSEEMTSSGAVAPGVRAAISGREVLHSGPFTLRRYAQVGSSDALKYGRFLLFCLRGSVELRLQSCRYRLTPGYAALLDSGQLVGYCCDADSELLEYRPRTGAMSGYGDDDGCPAFTVFPQEPGLGAWAASVSRRIRSGAVFGRGASCAVRVQLRDLSGGELPYPFSCAAGCSRWNRCAAVAGYAGWSPADAAQTELPLGERIVTAVAATVGIGLWGGLLLYGVWHELSRLF